METIALLALLTLVLLMWGYLRHVENELKELKQHTSEYVKINENYKNLQKIKNELTQMEMDAMKSDVSILWKDFGKRLNIK
jgi:Tfp pilus assembly protein PilO